MKKKLKLLFFSSGLAPEYGGAAISEASLCKALEKDAEVQIVCRQDRWNRKFVRDFGLNTPKEFSPKDFYSCWRSASHPLRDWFESTDLIHLNGHWRWEYYFVSLIADELSIPYVLHPRGMMLVGGRKYHLKRVFNFLMGNQLVKKAQKLIALSEFETEQLRRYSFDQDKVQVIPNGVCGLFPNEENLENVDLSDHFLYFGRLEHRKNLLFLLDAYAQYLRKGGQKKLRLKGPIEHGYEQLIHRKVEELAISHHVSLLAPCYGMDKWRQLAQAVAVIYPCLDEPFGRVPFETLLSGGLPILPEESGGAEYLKSLISPAIYPTHSMDGLCERLFWAENLTINARATLLSSAKDWVRKELDWARVSERVQKTYREALAQAATDRSSPATSELALNE